MLPFHSSKAWSTIRGYHSALQDFYKGIDLLADLQDSPQMPQEALAGFEKVGVLYPQTAYVFCLIMQHAIN